VKRAALAELLPHGTEAILLTAVVRHDRDTLEATAAVPVTSPYAHGPCASAALVEAAAQAIGVHVGLAAATCEERRPATPGYLVGIKNGYLAASLPLAEQLTVSVQRTGGSGPLAIYAARVSRADRVLLRADLSVWTPPPGPKT